MAYGEPRISIEGRLAGDPELRFTPGGAAKCEFAVLVTPQVKDNETGKFGDGTPTRYNVVVWRKAAENAAESLSKGTLVVIHGTVGTRTWTPEGSEEPRYWTEVTAEAIGVSLKWDPVKVVRMERASAGNTPAGGSSADEWATR